MLKVAYLAVPKYLSDGILSSIAKEIHKFGMNYYIETNEEPSKSIPENFDMILRIKKELVEEALENIKSRNILKIVTSVHTLEKHVNERMDFLNPDAIVTTSDMGGLVTRLCNKWAVNNKRPFFIMQPSFLDECPKTLKTEIINKLMYYGMNVLLKTPVCRRQGFYGNERKTNYNLIWSDEFSNQLTKETLKNTFYVGNPALDKCANQKVRLLVKEPVVLICTQPYDKLAEMGILKLYQALEIIVMLEQVVQQNQNVHFIIKVHPSEDENKYVKLFGGMYGKNHAIVQSRKPDGINYCSNIMNLLKVADIQVSMASYTSFESVVAGVPTIILHAEYLNFFDQFNDIAFQHAKSVEELNSCIRMALNRGNRESFINWRKDYLNKKLKFFGSSAEITAKTISRVVEWQRPKFK